MKVLFSILFSALLVAVTLQASAQSPDLQRLHIGLGEHVLLTLPGRVEVIGAYTQGMPVEVIGEGLDERLPEDLSLYGRLRFAPSLYLVGNQWPLFQAYKLTTDVELAHEMGESSADELLALDPVHAKRLEPTEPELYELKVSAGGTYLALSFGLMRSSWGMGMLSNPGDVQAIQSGASPFGFARSADRVVRALVATYPLGQGERAAEMVTQEPPLTIALGADAVLEDDNADWLIGDRTWHALGALRGAYAGFLGGLYGVHRRQRHAEGGETALTLIDLYLRQELKNEDVRVWAEVEAAIAFGETSYAQNPLNPGPQSILSGGGLGRMGVNAFGFGLVLEAGYASGDDNPYDNERSGFTFDREHRVGLLMFREALREASAVSASNVGDPEYRASPPRGYEKMASAGALRGAIYVNPRVHYEVIEGLTLMAGYLHARSDGPYSDPFQSGLMGGASMGLQGTLQPDHFGDEIDLGVDYRVKLGLFALNIRAEFAWFRPGDIFARPAPEDSAPDQMGGWLHGRLSW